MRSVPAILLLLGVLTVPAAAQYFNDYEVPPHNYFKAEKRDPMSLLMKRVAAGEVKIEEENGKALVERLLRELNLDKATQTLVFSKTSLQKRAVSYQNPRALYFNDSVYLGWMPGGRIEITSFDPELGPRFYFQRPLNDDRSRLFVETKSCLGCHAGDATNFLPGALGRSVYPDRTGRSMKGIDDYRRSGHQIPFDVRWGGWFVSGKHGAMRHMGNALGERVNGSVTMDRDKFANVAKLDQFFDTDAFPAPGSDIAALLVFDHQITMHHRLVEAAYRARQALFDSKLDPSETDVSKLGKGRPQSDFNEGVEMMIEYLLFKEEVPLPGKVECDPEFQRAFSADKRTDKKGRSLKDFQLEDRIFKHRCSYMIHSPSFQAMAPMMKQAIYKELRTILTSPKPVEGYDYFADGEREAIFEILSETVDGFGG